MADFHIRLLRAEESLPLELLLSADPSVDAIQVYLPNSKVYIAETTGNVIGVYVLFSINAQEAEIKNIAVDEAHLRQGIGTLLLKHAIRLATEQGFKKLLIGTSNASVGQLYLYQKMGFELSDIKFNFFIDNYTEPIIENGVQCKHMIMLSTTLK